MPHEQQFKLSTKAKSDLHNIAQYTEAQWDKAQRNHYLKQLDGTFHLLAKHPAIGKDCGEIRAGYRKFPQGNHVIFYKQSSNNTIQIIRILHKSMDVTLWL